MAKIRLSTGGCLGCPHWWEGCVVAFQSCRGTLMDRRLSNGINLCFVREW